MTERIIPLHLWGTVVSGENLGCMVRVDDDRGASGGFQVYMGPAGSTGRMEEVFDFWLASPDDVRAMFEEEGLAVAWPDKSGLEWLPANGTT